MKSIIIYLDIVDQAFSLHFFRHAILRLFSNIKVHRFPIILFFKTKYCEDIIKLTFLYFDFLIKFCPTNKGYHCTNRQLSYYSRDVSVSCLNCVVYLYVVLLRGCRTDFYRRNVLLLLSYLWIIWLNGNDSICVKSASSLQLSDLIIVFIIQVLEGHNWSRRDMVL